MKKEREKERRRETERKINIIDNQQKNWKKRNRIKNEEKKLVE